MSSPFPGMDPYLEAPEIWHDFHHLLADEIIAQLNALLSPRDYADVEVRTVLEEVGVATTKTVYSNAAAQFIAVCSAYNLSEARCISSPLLGSSLAKTRAFSRPSRAHAPTFDVLQTARN